MQIMSEFYCKYIGRELKEKCSCPCSECPSYFSPESMVKLFGDGADMIKQAVKEKPSPAEMFVLFYRIPSFDCKFPLFFTIIELLRFQGGRGWIYGRDIQGKWFLVHIFEYIVIAHNLVKCPEENERILEIIEWMES